jgi:sulfite reductase alpha subunit
VFGYGGGVIPRFTELKDDKGAPVFPDAAEFHTLRIQPPAGMHYTPTCCARCATSGKSTARA